MIGFVHTQTIIEADKKFSRITHRTRLFNRKNIRRFETSSTNRNDERLSQLSDNISGEFLGDLSLVVY